ncbi:YcaO-related McrA-glycine thioamidation protein [Methanosarcina sp. MSH10X1]|uniref:YcaO-related McrA-glycine thioamidation protein n=1 Tax=Methanosarcina sp. MSH10X1 TaxID=2507075 RepID=UPI000FFBD480|nr:YcaO-related McrA-glycine thioamidation protein [Methanosarcina sp. MSH10X1]RXA21258.1 YcaO-related McrA-glycine thioamidation protein [Methanosarcina sp. MSH10X1]
MPEIKIDRSISYLEGTQRVYDEATTLENTKDEIKKIGVTRIADITNLDRLGIPIFSAIRPSAAKGAISIYSGKGSTEQRARISAIMESFERCLAERPGLNANIKSEISAPALVESYNTSRESCTVLDPATLLLPQPHLPQSLCEWVGAYDIINSEEVFVSANAVYHPYNSPGQCQKLFLSNTNGLASGNIIEEAILHGLLEVIERDVISIGQFSRNLGKEIVLTEEDGYLYELASKFKDAGIELKVWLVPTDTGIPTVIAVTDDLKLKDPALLVMGAGSHLKPEIAVARAITEAAQSRVVQIQGAREDTDREDFIRSVGYDRMKRLNGFWFEEGEKISLSQVQDLSRKSPAENIDVILEKLKGLAERVLVVDLSREEVKVPVVRVIIPGFELFTIDRDRKGKRIGSQRKREFSRDKNEKPWKRR